MAAPWSSYMPQIEGAKSSEELRKIELELFGRKSGLLTSALKGLKDLPDTEKRAAAQELNEWKRTLETAIDERSKALRSSDDALSASDAIDPTLSLPERERGHLHLIPEFIREVEEVFGRMGFEVFNGPEIETEEFNFNLLNYEPDHPARDAQDTFFVKKTGQVKTLLRTHTSAGQIRYMQSHKPPLRAVFPGKCYRKDADATHSPMFHQFEGLMVGDSISLAHLKGVMITAVRELIDPDAEFRFRTGFFPFVEPGLEMDMRWRGESKTREGKWLEVVGSGMVHPNVLQNCGIDPEKYSGLAFGFGIERLLMIRHQIPNIRAFFEGDLRFLRQF